MRKETQDGGLNISSPSSHCYVAIGIRLEVHSAVHTILHVKKDSPQ